MKKILLSLSLVLFALMSNVNSVLATNVGTLVDCDQSPAFTKRLNTSVKKLETRLAKYESGTPLL